VNSGQVGLESFVEACERLCGPDIGKEVCLTVMVFTLTFKALGRRESPKRLTISMCCSVALLKDLLGTK
jgi:hypothetical protein